MNLNINIVETDTITSSRVWLDVKLFFLYHRNNSVVIHHFCGLSDLFDVPKLASTFIPFKIELNCWFEHS